MSCSQLRVSGSGSGYPVQSDYSTASELVQGYDKMNIWGSPSPSPATILVAGKPLASFITDMPNASNPLPTQVVGGRSTDLISPTSTQTFPGATSTRVACKKSSRRLRRIQSSTSPAIRRGSHHAHRAKRHNDFHY